MQLSPKMLPKVPRSGVVTYRKIGVDQINPISDPPQPIIPPTSIMVGTTEVYDRFEEDMHMQTKTVRNVVSSVTKRDGKGQSYVEEKVEPIVFESGFITINARKNYNTFVFLERHPGNKDNIYRPADAPVIFERVKEAKTTDEQLHDEMLAFEALRQANSRPHKDLLAIVSTFKTDWPANASVSDTKYQAIQLAKANPLGFLEANPTPETRVKLVIANALAGGIIENDLDNRQWKLGEKAILSYDLQDNAQEKLEAFLTEKGKALVDKIEQATLLVE